IVGMRLAIVMKHLGQIFPGHIQLICAVVVSRGDDYLSAAVIKYSSQPITRSYVESIVAPHHRFYPLVLPHVELVVLCVLAVILERLKPVRLRISTAERQIADFK